MLVRAGLARLGCLPSWRCLSSVPRTGELRTADKLATQLTTSSYFDISIPHTVEMPTPTRLSTRHIRYIAEPHAVHPMWCAAT